MEWLSKLFKKDVPLDRVTVSSDAHTPSGSGEKYFGQFKQGARECGMKNILPFFTQNVATVLGLEKKKGRIAKGFDADITILDKSTMDVMHVFSMGRHVMNNGEVTVEINDKTTTS